MLTAVPKSLCGAYECLLVRTYHSVYKISNRTINLVAAFCPRGAFAWLEDLCDAV